MRRNRKVWGLVAALAGVGLLLGGVAVASNMGFKFVPDIPYAAGQNAFNLSLPWNNNYTNAESLYQDIATSSGLAVERVARLEPDAAITSWYTAGGGGGLNFPIVSGAAYLVFGGTSNTQNLHPVIVGSHNPNYTFTFNPGFFNAAAPYHQTYTSADGVWQAINTACPGKIIRVARLEPDAAITSWYTAGGGGGLNFGLVLGAGVAVEVNATCAGFVWAHY